jgi:probable F420-dependent oxidoreductase
MSMTTRPIRIASQLHPQHGAWPQLRDAAIRSELLGYDILYAWDHFSPLSGDPDGAHFECWSLLAAFAEATERIEIGPLVACNSYRNPNLHADIARTVDHISGGRVIMGLGAGWFERDYRRYGFEFGTRASRIRSLAEATPVIIERLATLNPPPLRRMPILVAGVGLTLTLPIVARYADSWHAFFPDSVEEVLPAVEALRRHCDAIGRDPHDIEWGVGLQPDDLDRFLAEDADRYVELGFTQFTLGFGGPEWRVEGGEAFLAWRDRLNARRLAETSDRAVSA